jgi:hypothetical protein
MESRSAMAEFPDDIFTEPADIDPDTLRNLGPLAPLAGVWEGVRGVDRHPEADGPLEEPYVERYALQPIDPQTNGPQLFYGLRYHAHITRPSETKMFHDQVGYWLWEPATGAVILTLSIPRGQIAMAAGTAAPSATRFTVTSAAGAPHYGTLSNPFLDHAFRTTEFRMSVTINPDGTWSYEQDTVLTVHGQAEPFHHTDRNTLKRIAPAEPNPLMRRARR